MTLALGTIFRWTDISSGWFEMHPGNRVKILHNGGKSHASTNKLSRSIIRVSFATFYRAMIYFRGPFSSK